MPPPNRTRLPTGFTSLEWIVTDDGSRTLFDARINETFHSGCGAVAETLIVYLFHSGVLERLRNRLPSVVVEYGLGTATGLLLTAAMAEVTRTPLTYYALEYALLPASLLSELQLAAAVQQCINQGDAKPARGLDPNFQSDEFQHLPRLAAALVNGLQRDVASPPVTSAVWQLSEFVQLHLLLGDIRHLTVNQTLGIPLGTCDAIYFDPFSPETNPELWSAEIFRPALDLLKPSGRLTSYCVKSSIRRELLACGFKVDKVAGPMRGKREVLCASKP